MIHAKKNTHNNYFNIKYLYFVLLPFRNFTEVSAVVHIVQRSYARLSDARHNVRNRKGYEGVDSYVCHSLWSQILSRSRNVRSRTLYPGGKSQEAKRYIHTVWRWTSDMHRYTVNKLYIRIFFLFSYRLPFLYLTHSMSHADRVTLVLHLHEAPFPQLFVHSHQLYNMITSILNRVYDPS